MKLANPFLILAAGALLTTAPLVNAQKAVHETADGDLLVIDYSGKPPFKRQRIRADDRNAHPQLERFNDSVLVGSTVTRRSGAPGKSLPSQKTSLERVPASELESIARFEETEKPAAGNNRLWRGAPGKGKAQLSRD